MKIYKKFYILYEKIRLTIYNSLNFNVPRGTFAIYFSIQKQRASKGKKLFAYMPVKNRLVQGRTKLNYTAFISSLILSAISAINSLFVGLPLLPRIVYPKNSFKTSGLPLSQATSIAWRIALSTLDAVVL